MLAAPTDASTRLTTNATCRMTRERNHRVPGGFGQSFNWEGIKSLTLEDGVLGGKVTLATGAPVNVSAAPHKTVSQSEGGFEKIMQAVCICIRAPAGNSSVKVQLTMEMLSA